MYTRQAPAAPSVTLWTEADVAAFLGKSREAVRKMRGRKQAPPHYTIGRQIRYNPRRVREWLEAQQGS